MHLLCPPVTEHTQFKELASIIQKKDSVYDSNRHHQQQQQQLGITGIFDCSALIILTSFKGL